ncbi:potassium channel family protein [Streptomyces physcomitrii]|uniref:Two pore domain potassium channel family protein n=1 Tax=Streptomyces physcomitrii TaxID=2724184 RepID=A0ABX1GXT4_9ACTN|nr:potassium channel family protein [Streptomyces physcomitrii]NKI40911.1 two pore domain potassium channel family protein [Streptomyces physcomitrii]
MAQQGSGPDRDPAEEPAGTPRPGSTDRTEPSNRAEGPDRTEAPNRTAARRRPGLLGRLWFSEHLWSLAGCLLAGLVVAYGLLPLDHPSLRRPALGWTLFLLALAVVAGLLLWHIKQVLRERTESHSGLVIAFLVCLSVLVFSAGYFVLAQEPGQMSGLRTRLDSLYFTVTTLATVGYGDISPRGQAARAVTILQISYTFVFLTAAATALSTHVRKRIGQGHKHGRDHGHRHHGATGHHGPGHTEPAPERHGNGDPGHEEHPGQE